MIYYEQLFTNQISLIFYGGHKMAKGIVSVLERREVPVDETSENDFSELVDFSGLAEDARKILGYSGLKEEIVSTKIKVERAKIDNEAGKDLRQAMEKLGIKPFTEDSVKRYKKKTQWRAISLRERFCEPIALGFFFLMCFAVAVAIVGFVAMTTFLLSPEWSKTTMGAAAIVGVVSLLFFLGFGCAVPEKKTTSVRWKLIPISEYEGPIPEFALQTAVDLGKACRNSRFFVEELIVKKEVVDPFLVVTLGDAKYYLEVWNEPGFKGKREA